MNESDNISRRFFLKSSAAAVGVAALSSMAGGRVCAATLSTTNPKNDEQGKATVFFTKDLSAAGLRKLYARVNQGMTGRIAVKLHTGEPGGPNIIPREMVKELMHDVPGGVIVECNVLYDSPRKTTDGHKMVIAGNGWTFCPVDIMDEHGDVNLPVKGGKWFKEVAFGKNILNYDSMLVLTHFKGHALGGFGGSLKNIAIGCASGKVGKAQLHDSDGSSWPSGPDFMERMVEGGKAVADHFGQHITYINVLRNMSVDCDCAGISAAPPTAPDLGILASTDILAIDQASVDMVYALPEAQKADLVERMESRSGLRQLEYMKELGMGKSGYELVVI
ncbi:DUF362 domain-containing protein [Desulfovibrio intestinalis]|uniref:DUF362 domain-containing protein n=1 Tax=Desulfovibrio intestinalis TaxID=58621 RepID=A0A7W8FEA1_9BACT|nr:DUF362 domain-containing protein [Desulfovibrio intestinalis]MBB5143539.1 hypothetical protein [Desulfovibrio intestinalis]